MKQTFIIIAIIIVVMAVLYVFKDQLGWQSTYEVTPSPQGITPTGSVEPTTTPTLGSEPTKELAPQDVVTVASMFPSLAADFDNYTPFTINRIWMQDSSNFYVEYKNARGDLSQILVVKENGQFKGMGYFAPSEADWQLQAGEGEPMKANAVFYEKDAAGNWVKKN